jgi:hypothetical protein
LGLAAPNIERKKESKKETGEVEKERNAFMNGKR